MRAARDGSVPRSEASPAAADGDCHSECTSAHPSACVAVMRFLVLYNPFGRCLCRVQRSALCTELLVRGERPVAPSPTLDDGELFAACKLWLGHQVRHRGLSRCSRATLPAPPTGTAAATHGAHADRDPCDLLLVLATGRPVTKERGGLRSAHCVILATTMIHVSAAPTVLRAVCLVVSLSVATAGSGLPMCVSLLAQAAAPCDMHSGHNA